MEDGLFVLSNSKTSSAPLEARRAIAQARNLDELVRVGLDYLCTNFHCDAAFLLKQSASNDAVCWAASPASLPNLTIPGLPARLEQGSLAARALEQRKTVFISEPGIIGSDNILVAVLLDTQGTQVGVLQLSGASRNLSAPSIVAAVESFASTFADAVTRMSGP